MTGKRLAEGDCGELANKRRKIAQPKGWKLLVARKDMQWDQRVRTTPTVAARAKKIARHYEPAIKALLAHVRGERVFSGLRLLLSAAQSRCIGVLDTVARCPLSEGANMRSISPIERSQIMTFYWTDFDLLGDAIVSVAESVRAHEERLLKTAPDHIVSAVRCLSTLISF